MLVLLLATFLVALTPMGASSSPAVPPLPVRPTGLFVPPTGSLFGAWVDPDGQWTGNAAAQSEVATFESQIGRTLDIDQHYYAWTDTFPSGLEQWDVANGRMPMISWKGTTLSGIINGSYDTMIRTRADALKALGTPVFLRWAWEMNGEWEVWSGAQNGGAGVGPASFVTAWKHIHDIFVQEGAANVAWVWAPNTEDAPNASWNHWTNYYPGDPYVDWVGIDGFNWGTTHTWATWRTLAQIIGPMYADYAATKPIMVAETGSVEQGGSKPQWFTGARNDIENTFPSVAAFVYFDAGDSHSPSDFRVTTSATAASAYKAMGQDPYFKPRQGGGTQAPPPPVSGVFVWPQPATKSAPVAFTTGSSVTVSIQIQNSSGGVVRQLATAVPYGAGTFAVTWDRKDDRGRKTGAGTYRAVVTATDSTGASSTDSQLFQAK